MQQYIDLVVQWELEGRTQFFCFIVLREEVKEIKETFKDAYEVFTTGNEYMVMVRLEKKRLECA